MVYKHAISTVVPARQCAITHGEDGEVTEPAIVRMTSLAAQLTGRACSCLNATGVARVPFWWASGIGQPVDPHDMAEFKALAPLGGHAGRGRVSGGATAAGPEILRRFRKARKSKPARRARSAWCWSIRTLSPSQERNLENSRIVEFWTANGLIWTFLPTSPQF